MQGALHAGQFMLGLFLIIAGMVADSDIGARRRR